LLVRLTGASIEPMTGTRSPRVDIAHRRLAHQHLLTSTLRQPADVVRRLGAVQAQDYAGAKWAVGMRTRGRVGDAAVERALREERVPPAPAHSPDRDEALLELTRRYFVTRGPATLKDFAWWSGLTVADASRGVQIAGQSLEREVIGDETYWSDARARSQRKSSVMAHLLPNYDEYFIGFKNRSAIEQRLGAPAVMMRDAL